jgi:hypothetical protein
MDADRMAKLNKSENTIGDVRAQKESVIKPA